MSYESVCQAPGAVGVAAHARFTTPAALEVVLLCEAGACTRSVFTWLLGLVDVPVKLAEVSLVAAPTRATVTMNASPIARRRSPLIPIPLFVMTRALQRASASARASRGAPARPRRDRRRAPARAGGLPAAAASAVRPCSSG